MICKECKKSYMALSPDGYCGNCEPADLRLARITEMGREAVRPIKEHRRRDLFERVALDLFPINYGQFDCLTKPEGMKLVALITTAILKAADEFAIKEPPK